MVFSNPHKEKLINNKYSDMKICFKCGVKKPLNEFYKHKLMADGHINKCISCAKKDVKKRESLLKNNIEWLEKERQRNRDKYYRLEYRIKHKPIKEKKKINMEKYNIKFPEKYRARIKSQRIIRKKGYELHHWNYNLEYAKDVIELTVSDHNLLHRYLKYDKEKMIYRNFNGDLLETKESHIELLQLIKKE